MEPLNTWDNGGNYLMFDVCMSVHKLGGEKKHLFELETRPVVKVEERGRKN